MSTSLMNPELSSFKKDKFGIIPINIHHCGDLPSPIMLGLRGHKYLQTCHSPGQTNLNGYEKKSD